MVSDSDAQPFFLGFVFRSATRPPARAVGKKLTPENDDEWLNHTLPSRRTNLPLFHPHPRPVTSSSLFPRAARRLSKFTTSFRGKRLVSSGNI